MIGAEAEETHRKAKARKATDVLAEALTKTHGALACNTKPESSPSGVKASTLTTFPYGLVCMSPK